MVLKRLSIKALLFFLDLLEFGMGIALSLAGDLEIEARRNMADLK